MNSTVFSIKRCFLRTVHLGRKVLAQFGLTPARFDALYTLRKKEWRHQSQIWKILGLHPSTICRLLGRLEELGFIFRNVDPDDTRQVVVKLSSDGEKALEKAIEVLVENGAYEAFVEWAVAGPNRREDKRAVAVLNFEERLVSVRRTLLDTARLLYAFDPEEWPPLEGLVEWPMKRAA